MIDLHSHVLPGLDDGPDLIEGSIEFVRAAAAQGTTVLAATPHLRDDYPDIRVETLADEAMWAQFVDAAEEAISREHTLWRASLGIPVRPRRP